MSQAKVDKYKEYKKNKKAIIAKEKRQQKLYEYSTYIVIVVGILLIVGTIILVTNQKHQEYLASIPDYKADSMIVEDMVGVLATEAEESEDASEETSEEATEEASTEENAAE